MYSIVRVVNRFDHFAGALHAGCCHADPCEVTATIADENAAEASVANKAASSRFPTFHGRRGSAGLSGQPTGLRDPPPKFPPFPSEAERAPRRFSAEGDRAGLTGLRRPNFGNNASGAGGYCGAMQPKSREAPDDGLFRGLTGVNPGGGGPGLPRPQWQQEKAPAPAPSKQTR